MNEDVWNKWIIVLDNLNAEDLKTIRKQVDKMLLIKYGETNIFGD